MRCPTVPRLLAAFPRSLGRQGALLIRALAARVDDPARLASVIEGNAALKATSDYVRRMHGDPYASAMWRRTVALHAMDQVLGTHGVEPLGPVDERQGPPYEYLNAGDTYNETMIYDRDADRVFIGSWGEVVERDERQPRHKRKLTGDE